MQFLLYSPSSDILNVKVELADGTIKESNLKPGDKYPDWGKVVYIHYPDNAVITIRKANE